MQARRPTHLLDVLIELINKSEILEARRPGHPLHAVVEGSAKVQTKTLLAILYNSYSCEIRFATNTICVGEHFCLRRKWEPFGTSMSRSCWRNSKQRAAQWISVSFCKSAFMTLISSEIRGCSFVLNRYYVMTQDV